MNVDTIISQLVESTPVDKLVMSGGYVHKHPRGYYLTILLTRIYKGSKAESVPTGNYKLKAYDADIGFVMETVIKPKSKEDLEQLINKYVEKWTRKYDEVAPRAYELQRKLRIKESRE